MRMFKDIHPRWQQEAKRSTQPLIILSPYITKDVALSLVKGKTGARIYTLFDTNVFATGGSDLEDVVELMQKQEVYQLDGLHAKLVTDKDTFVTLGSQNLTQGGKHNLELSVHLNDEPARRQAMDIVEPWLDDAERITPEMVADMRVDIERLKALYEEFQKQCAEHQKDFVDKSRRRARRERFEAHAKNRAAIASKLKKALRASITKTAQVKRIDQSSVLKTEDKANLLVWERPNGKVEATLNKGDRYLCFLESNDFGWARVAGQQISLIGRGIIFGPGIFNAFPKLSLRVSSAARSLIGHPDGTNLVVSLWWGKSQVCTVPGSFQLDDITLFEAKRPKPARPKIKGRPEPVQPAPTTLTREVITWIAENSRSFELLVRRSVTESFNYTEGHKLTGVRAARFFGKPGSRVKIRLAKVRNNPVLHVSPLPS
ncbi:hypothetical protein KDL27_20335 [Pseudomonas syringae pv. syringae]|uniref:Phospholipase D-like domain-containing protein n=1 Tax=Pseudomonas syringae pv. syringae TaxID=321 RepID=A0AB35JXK6_PSESY|nr:hypothetical protein [Pseudomonas syringae]MDC3738140.1 hypothetical protein [Pseudomonas syringae pv. syringae]